MIHARRNARVSKGTRCFLALVEHKKELKPATDFWQTMDAYLQVPSFASYSGSMCPRSNSYTFTSPSPTARGGTVPVAQLNNSPTSQAFINQTTDRLISLGRGAPTAVGRLLPMAKWWLYHLRYLALLMIVISSAVPRSLDDWWLQRSRLAECIAAGCGYALRVGANTHSDLVIYNSVPHMMPFCFAQTSSIYISRPPFLLSNLLDMKAHPHPHPPLSLSL